MQLYDILKAGKTDKAPDSRTLLLARKLFPPPNSGLPVTRGLRSVLHLADFDAQKSTWTDTTFGKVYTGASVYHQSYGVCMNANEPLFSGFNFNTDDFTVYIITTAKDYYATWSHYLVGSSDGKDNWKLHAQQPMARTQQRKQQQFQHGYFLYLPRYDNRPQRQSVP